MSSFTTSSSADEFSPLQPIFPNLSKSEEMSVLIARIAELNRAKTMGPSVASSEVFGQDGYGMNDDQFSLDDEEEEGEQQEDRKTPTKDVLEDHLKAILERIGEMEKQQNERSKAAEERFSQLQNDQMKILEKVSEMEKKQTKKKVFLKFQENCWDSFACHKDIEIIGDKSLIVHHKGPTAWRSVFAKYPIVLNKHLSDFFYYEISVQKKEKSNWSIFFGFAVKQQTKLDRAIHFENGTYAFYSNCYIWINGKGKGRNDEYSYGVDDTVGIGVNSATRKIIFTKNGLRLDTSDFLVDPSFADGSLYPFVTLWCSDDKIEANFGPNFKFDLATL